MTLFVDGHATATPRFPFHLPAQIATGAPAAVATFFEVGKFPVPLPNRKRTWFRPASAIARSIFPSPLKSAATTSSGPAAVVTMIREPRMPLPTPVRTARALSVALDAITSGGPAPFRSPTATAAVPEPEK